MPAITVYGYVGPDSRQPAWPDFTSNIDDFDPVDLSPPVVTMEHADQGAATLTSHQPVAENEEVKDAWIQPSFLDDYYYRVHLLPPVVALGNLLSSQVRTVEVWNAYFEPNNLLTVGSSGTDGVTLTEPVPSPTEFAPLESRFYQVNVSTVGPAVLDALYSFQFDTETVELPVTGRRVVMLPYPPNWKMPVTEALEWVTNVIPAFDGGEQRRSLRTKARRSFNYSIRLKGREAARFDNLLWGWQNRVYAMPVWTDKGRLTAPHSAGSTSLLLDTEGLSFSAGSTAVLYGDERTSETVEIESILPGELALTHPTTATWGEGTLVMPCVVGHLPNSVPVMRHTSGVAEATIDFACDPVLTDPYTPEAAAPVTFQGLEVITRQPNWKSGISNASEYAFEVLDQMLGAIRLMHTESFPRVQKSYQWTLMNRGQIQGYREMLGRLKGRLKTLFVPTWHDDFKVISTIGAADGSIRVKDDDFHSMVGLDTARNHLMVRLWDGTRFLREITHVSMDTGDTLVFIDEPLGVTVQPEEVLSVHCLMRSRLASDRVEFSWKSDRVAVVDNVFTNVRE